MSTDDGVESAEDTFADVLNGLSGRGRRRRDRHAESTPQVSAPVNRNLQWGDEPGEENASIVRAYSWTGGRTRSEFQLEIETLVSTSERADEMVATLSIEHQSVARLCHQSKSVAEVGALLSLPLGVVRVLLGDMATMGLVDVHSNQAIDEDDRPNLDLLERVLQGLTNLRTASARQR